MDRQPRASLVLKPAKSTNFKIKNVIIQNFYGGACGLPQSHKQSGTILRNKPQKREGKKADTCECKMAKGRVR